jgi:ATP-dependent exoDNAse (exonuclease V) beta subunit
VPAPADVHGWRPRDGVFSYSSAHEQMTLREAAASARPQIPPRAQQDAEAEGAPYTDDADKATGLGSAFHQLAQTMVQTGRDHDPERQAALERTWHLSERQRQRLAAAVARWEGSALRREALAHDHVRAEFPFFCAVSSGYGSYVEGAIDLLATDEGSDHALVVDYKTGDIGLTVEEIEERHRMQANFYAWVLTSRGYRTVSCAFCCVELDDGFGGPLVVRYEFEAQGESRPRI